MSQLMERERLLLLAAVRAVLGFQAEIIPARHWRGRRSHERAAPLTKLGCRLLGMHLTANTPPRK